jgi:hypothetical protein
MIITMVESRKRRRSDHRFHLLYSLSRVSVWVPLLVFLGAVGVDYESRALIPLAFQVPVE